MIPKYNIYFETNIICRSKLRVIFIYRHELVSTFLKVCDEQTGFQDFKIYHLTRISINSIANIDRLLESHETR